MFFSLVNCALKVKSILHKCKGPGAESKEHGAESGERRAKSMGQRAGSQEPEARSQKPEARSQNSQLPARPGTGQILIAPGEEESRNFGITLG